MPWVAHRANATRSVVGPLSRARAPKGHVSMVPTAGLEPARLAAQRPQRCASTNSARWAKRLRIVADARAHPALVLPREAAIGFGVGVARGLEGFHRRWIGPIDGDVVADVPKQVQDIFAAWRCGIGNLLVRVGWGSRARTCDLRGQDPPLLPTELSPNGWSNDMVGRAGLEPATNGVRVRRSTS